MTGKDVEQLGLLAKVHYFVAAFQALIGCMPIFHFAIGAWMAFSPATFGPAKDPPPAWFGGFLMAISGVFILSSWTIALGLVVVARNLARRKRYLFCLAVEAAAVVLSVPLGTVLGVLTIIVLVRPTVKAAFESARAGIVEAGRP